MDSSNIDIAEKDWVVEILRLERRKSQKETDPEERRVDRIANDLFQRTLPTSSCNFYLPQLFNEQHVFEIVSQGTLITLLIDDNKFEICVGYDRVFKIPVLDLWK